MKRNLILLVIAIILALFLFTEIGPHGQSWETSIKNMKTTNTVRITN